MAATGVLDASSAQIYQYLNFDKIDDYKTEAAAVA
jgi:aconitate hydratase 2/2-methylisocitrate dehydratase